MNKIIKIIILETVILVVLALLLILPEQKSMAEVCFQDSCFKVEVADNPTEQQKGLMFRESLKKDKGMLFVFKKEGSYPFWMKNTLIPLDIIWINQNQEVVFIQEYAEPCRETCDPIDPKQNAKYVLEVNGGIAQDINLTVGNRVAISY